VSGRDDDATLAATGRAAGPVASPVPAARPAPVGCGYTGPRWCSRSRSRSPQFNGNQEGPRPPPGVAPTWAAPATVSGRKQRAACPSFPARVESTGGPVRPLGRTHGSSPPARIPANGVTCRADRCVVKCAAAGKRRRTC